MISAVLPLRITPDRMGSGYEENIKRAQILVESLQRFARFTLPLYIVVRADEMHEIGQSCSSTENVPISFVDENSLVPDITAIDAFGWYKQQVIKLAFTAASSEPFCLTLDPDVLAVAQIDETDLVKNGLAVTQWRGKQVTNSVWANLRALGLLVDMKAPCLWLTPCVLSKNVAAATLDRLPANVLARIQGWTEYAIYTAIGQHTGLLAKHHQSLSTSLIGQSLWDRTALRRYKIKPLTGKFAVIHGKARITPKEARAIYEQVLK